MKYQAFRMDFTPRELFYFLFKKKRCPFCGGRLRRAREFETRYGREFLEKREPFLANSVRVKYYFYTFTCEECGHKYSLHDLADGAPQK